MVVSNVTFDQLKKALHEINEKMFAGNVVFKRDPEKFGRKIRFTLTVKKSADKGGRRGYQGQRVCAACWHVHGHFFDAVFNLEPKASFLSARKTITLDDGNWVDIQCGSIMNPKCFSEMCDCQNWVWDTNFVNNLKPTSQDYGDGNELLRGSLS